MSDTAIKVENLGKKYIIHHETKEPYHTFQDAMKKGAQKLVSTLNPFHKTVDQIHSEEFWALQDINFEIKQGDKVGIIGRNGAGKSTLLKVLSRITEPTTGKIYINGRIASLLEVGTGFHPELTGRENIFLNGAILGMSRREIKSKFDEIVAFSEVEKFLDTPVKRYSSGMYVRLAFSVAAHLEPEILVVDEVLAVGDTSFQKKCIGKMDDVAKQGRTVVFVSHDIQTISTLTDTVMLLDKGKMVFTGKTTDGIKHYLQLQQDTQMIFTNNEPSETIPNVVKIELSTSLPLNVHENGKPFRILIGVKMPRYEEGLAMAVQIKDIKGQSILHQSIFDANQQICRNIGENYIELTFPHLRLYIGTYTITVHLAQTKGTVKYDTVHDKCTFEVVLYHKEHGYKWQEGMCQYIEDVEWRIL